MLIFAATVLWLVVASNETPLRVQQAGRFLWEAAKDPAPPAHGKCGSTGGDLLLDLTSFNNC